MGLEESFLSAFRNEELEVSLSDDEKQMLEAMPNTLPKLWGEMSKAILLHHYPEIMSAQVDKAKRGDTASAKFITEFVTPNDSDSDTRQVEVPRWETLAISLRDRLGIEASAQELVVMLLDKLHAMPQEEVLVILNYQAGV